MHRLGSIGMLLLWLCSGVALADERILSFHSDIQVFQNGTMSVTETIRVRAEGKQIKRGIYRDFPTSYRDLLGNHYTVGFELLGVTRDGQAEAYHTEKTANGVRIYMGRKSVYLKPGVYSYTLSYHTDRQLGFFDQHDELYWNVTGNDWAFPIDQASASVQLPAGIQAGDVRLEGYTGVEGSKGHDYQAQTDTYGLHRFESTRPLRTREGMSIVVMWPKGYVTQPDLQQRVSRQLRDNSHVLAGLLAALVLAGYYLLAWWRVGRDPRAGVIMTHYEPPKGFSPASMRFIRNMGHDDKTFASALINLAIKGYLKIVEKDGDYTLKKQPLTDQPRMAPGEKAMINKLFKSGSSLALEKTNHESIRAAKKAHEESLANDYERLYFNSNKTWMIPGLIITVVQIALMVLFSPSGDQRMIMLFYDGLAEHLVRRDLRPGVIGHSCLAGGCQQWAGGDHRRGVHHVVQHSISGRLVHGGVDAGAKQFLDHGVAAGGGPGPECVVLPVAESANAGRPHIARPRGGVPGLPAGGRKG